MGHRVGLHRQVQKIDEWKRDALSKNFACADKANRGAGSRFAAGKPAFLIGKFARDMACAAGRVSQQKNRHSQAHSSWPPRRRRRFDSDCREGCNCR
jgi:hypothetical protein